MKKTTNRNGSTDLTKIEGIMQTWARIQQRNLGCFCVAKLWVYLHLVELNSQPNNQKLWLSLWECAILYSTQYWMLHSKSGWQRYDNATFARCPFCDDRFAYIGRHSANSSVFFAIDFFFPTLPKTGTSTNAQSQIVRNGVWSVLLLDSVAWFVEEICHFKIDWSEFQVGKDRKKGTHSHWNAGINCHIFWTDWATMLRKNSKWSSFKGLLSG